MSCSNFVNVFNHWKYPREKAWCIQRKSFLNRKSVCWVKRNETQDTWEKIPGSWSKGLAKNCSSTENIFYGISVKSLLWSAWELYPLLEMCFLNIWYCLGNRNIKPFSTLLLLFANGLSCYEHIFCNLSVTICDMKVAGRDIWKRNRQWRVVRKDGDHYEISHDAINSHRSCCIGWKQWCPAHLCCALCRMRVRFPVAESQLCCTLVQRVVNAAIKQIKW